MDTASRWRDSLIIMAVVVIFAYVAASALSLLVGATPSNQVTAQIVLVILLFLAVLGLGFILWRSEASPVAVREKQ